jgi:hypothetical protein
MKNEVYSWRLSTDLKTSLEREAHRRKISLSTVLELAARDWLSKSGADTVGDHEQLRLQNEVSACFGILAGGNAHRAENAGEAVRQRLRRRHGR